MQVKDGVVSYNELNAESQGGTELTGRGLYERLTPEELAGFQIISSRVRELDPDLIKVLWLHDLAGDPESQHLADPVSRDRFSKLVFSSNWQYQQFRDKLGVPYSYRSTVIETGIDPIPYVERRDDEIRLIYTSTPHRGLAILIPVFVELAKRYPQLRLDVFSSFGIYGSNWVARDLPYEGLFQTCRDHPQITYHGWADQETVRAAYQRAHVFAFPSIWEETSCRCLIEAMSAGCVCVHPNLGALPDTSGGMTAMYDGELTDHNLHAQVFMGVLGDVVKQISRDGVNERSTKFVKAYADSRFSWDNVVPKWRGLLDSLRPA